MREAQHSEWKVSWREEHLRWVSGFDNVFFRAGQIEAWGRGIERILEACRDAGVPEPVLTHETTGLWIEFPFSPDYLARMGGGQPDSQPASRPATSLGTDPVTDPVVDPVTDPVHRMLHVLAGTERAPSAIQAALGLRHRPTFRANYLYPALDRGLVEMTIPEKPTSRSQRYRLTEAGRALLRALGSDEDQS